jgi:subtilisin-like proprotein convertase family protein
LSQLQVPEGSIGFRVGAPQGGTQSVHAESNQPIAIPDNDNLGITSKLHVDRAGTIRRLQVKLEIKHTYIGDLMVELEGPSGERAVLYARSGGPTKDLSIAYDSASLAALRGFVGAPVQGDWRLRVRDVDRLDVGQLLRWSIDAELEGVAGVVQAQIAPKAIIPDNDAVGVTSPLVVAASGSVGRLKVDVSITHTYIGDLRIELVAPSGRTVLLHGQLGGSTHDLNVNYDSAATLSPLSGLIGQSMQGTWRLRVADVARLDSGTLNSWKLEISPS